jgi:hypothetical protein
MITKSKIEPLAFLATEGHIWDEEFPADYVLRAGWYFEDSTYHRPIGCYKTEDEAIKQLKCYEELLRDEAIERATDLNPPI